MTWGQSSFHFVGTARRKKAVSLGDGRDSPAGLNNVVARRLRLAYEAAIYHVIEFARMLSDENCYMFR